MPVGLSIEVALYFNLKFVLVICVASSSVSTLHFGICNFYEYMKAVVSDEDGLNYSASDLWLYRCEPCDSERFCSHMVWHAMSSRCCM